jgi:hypothetical protein
MHVEILNKDQRNLLPFLAKFKREYYMVGGTAIALHIGHRLSIDFDLFKIGSIKPKSIFSKFDAARRSKWKDYVDLYFIIKDHYTVNVVSNRAAEIFGDMFSEKLFREQLSYFNGISFEEQVEFMPGFDAPEHIIKEFLVNASLEGF